MSGEGESHVAEQVAAKPGQYLEAHSITRELDRLGVTHEQRQSIRFPSSNVGYPFDQWATCWSGNVPREAAGLVKAYCALKWLILEDPPESEDTHHAWRLVSETVAAPIVAVGLRTKSAQSKRARKPRGKIAGFEETLGQLIKELALSSRYRDNTARELWPHFFDVLSQKDLDPTEIEDPTHHTACVYQYDSACGGRKEISFRRFANIVAKARSARSR